MPGFLCEPTSPGPRLTGRELEVAELVAEGLTNQAIARRLSVAPRTAEAHVENIRRKLQVRSRAQIAFRAVGDQFVSSLHRCGGGANGGYCVVMQVAAGCGRVHDRHRR
jgi:DNA-binding CsgD family transcriptional regulator